MKRLQTPFRAVFTTIVIIAIVLFMLLGIFLSGSKPKPQADVKAALPQSSTLASEIAVTTEKTAESLPTETPDTQKPKQDPFHLKLPNGYSLTMTGLEYGNYTNYSISRRGKVVWRSPVPSDGTESHYSVYETPDKWPDAVQPGEDITGSGTPDLVITNWSGGVHCCYTFQVFELGPKLRLLATFNVGDAGESHFEKRGDSLVFVTSDYVDPSGNILSRSFAESPAPEVILRFSNGKYRLADDLMRKPPLSRKKLLEISQAVQSDEEWENNGYPPVLLWSTMLDLIYTGNEKTAWDFFEKAWPKPRKGKQSRLREFKKILFHSQYWPQIRKMNRKFRIATADGKICDTSHYNLDVIISIGCRVKSRHGARFRIWALPLTDQVLISDTGRMTEA